MSQTYISASLRRLVEQRAGNRCEYCLLLAIVSTIPHEVDHVVAEKHGGETEEDNLALACWRCNRRKGSDLGSFDPLTGNFSFLFNPRTQSWDEHFEMLADHSILGITPEGRTTVSLLQLNEESRVTERRRIEEGLEKRK
ncbi:MAG: HNH endonuclease [Blastocatellales bacterium]